MAQVKISELTAKGSALQGTDLLEISQLVGSAYVSKSVNGGDIIDAAQSGMQSELISGTNIKTINSTSLLGSGNIDVQATLVSGTNIKTINGNSLLGSGDLVISGGGGSLTIGTTAITLGTIGRILFEGTGNVVQESANLFWDNTNSRLGIGTASPSNTLSVSGTAFITSNGSYGLSISRTGTSGIAQQIYNSTGTTYLGSDSSAGGFLFTGGLPYASYFGNAGNFPTQLGTNSAVRMTIFGGGNVAINTTTDAGYKLDVNGTARVQGKLSVNTPTASSAVMEVTSTTQGFLPPRMTTTQKNAISSPAAGLVVYDTTLNKLCVYTTAWETITSI